MSQLGREFNAMADSVGNLLERLKAGQRRLHNVMNSVDDGMLVLDRTLTVVATNQSMVRRLGIRRESIMATCCADVPGMPCARTLHDQPEQCIALRCFSSGRVQKSAQSWVSADGEEHMEEIFASPILGEDGQVEYVVEVWRDIADRRSIEANVAEFHRLASLGMLGAGIAHEVNTPLSSVLACVDVMRTTLRREPDQLDEADWMDLRETVDLVQGEIMRCKQITRRLLVLARSRAAGADIVSLDEMVASVVPLARKIASEASVALEVEGGQPPPVVLAPTGPVHQVLLNLLVNAIQACAAGDTVTVGWTVDDRLRLHVRDTGRGIGPADRSRIFEPFFTTREDGTGLGLFVSLGIVRGWGGDIEVDSEVGRGSTFTVSFPLADVAVAEEVSA